MIRFCNDCCQERTDTSWSDYFKTRLCVDCYNIRCESEPGPADLVEGGNGGWPNIPVTP